MNFTVDSNILPNVVSICESQSQVSKQVQLLLLQIHQSNHLQSDHSHPHHRLQRLSYLCRVHRVPQEAVFYSQLSRN